VNYPLASNTWDEKEYQAILRVLATGQLTMGKEVKEFEQQFATYVGSKHAVMVNSGSSANLVAVAALVNSKLRNKGRVIVPATGWSTTYSPFQQYGFDLCVVDVDDTFCISVTAVEQALVKHKDIVAICAVNLLGCPSDLVALRKLADQYGLVLFEDNCESLGATLEGKQTGTFGEVGTYSFFYSHHITTIEGGMVVTDDETLYKLMLMLRAHGWTRDVEPDDGSFDSKFRFAIPGYNLRPTELQGAIGKEQLKKLDGLVTVRRVNARRFTERMSGISGVTVQQERGESSWFAFAVLLDKSVDRYEVVKKLGLCGIESRPIVGGNFVNHKASEHYCYTVEGPLTQADRLHNRGLYVGNSGIDLSEQIDLLAECLEDATKTR